MERYTRMELDGIKIELSELESRIKELKKSLNISELEKEISELELITSQSGFWNDSKISSKVINSIKEKREIVDKYNKLNEIYSNSLEIYNLLIDEASIDKDMYNEMTSNILELKKMLEEIEIATLFNEEYDNMNAIVTVHPGAGGTESADWAAMLYRMYIRWAALMKYEVEIYDMESGDEAGIKSVTFNIKGRHSYGHMKCEKGVHRLVRISPFDANSRRHTSFAAVEVMPEIDDSIEVDIKSEDLDIGTYRASGAGGQHINKTDSAVRIKHIPTGLVVTCQTERSQLQNKENCMKMLKSKIYELEKEKNRDKLQSIKGENTQNSFGNQIRSYVFCPYTLVKDHRTNYEIGNVQKVMDGDITEFMLEYLKQNSNRG